VASPAIDSERPRQPRRLRLLKTHQTAANPIVLPLSKGFQYGTAPALHLSESGSVRFQLGIRAQNPAIVLTSRTGAML